MNIHKTARDQNALLLFYDGVYRIAVDKYLKCPEKFKQLIPCMGSFRMA